MVGASTIGVNVAGGSMVGRAWWYSLWQEQLLFRECEAAYKVADQKSRKDEAELHLG